MRGCHCLTVGTAILALQLTAPAHSLLAQIPASDQDKIANAMSAGPPWLASNASVLDWPASPGGEMKQLRAGSNGWTCLPESGPGKNDPMCLDAEWVGFLRALMSGAKPQVKQAGFGYMLQGDAGASNLDPAANTPTPTNQWVKSPAHLMLIVPDPALLKGLPTTPQKGAPYVMWAGTPYAHVMLPTH
ncbi:MAG: hypothetical protein HY703_04535 [Gemmatimonadetes bacterium]|nr:hypothetical protein [Gemmatimonadota bacterium]